MSRVIGIDLGTTNTVVSYFDGERAVVIKCEGLDHIPSFVCHDEAHSGQMLVGRDAKERLGEQPQNVAYSAKRLMGMLYHGEEDAVKMGQAHEREKFKEVARRVGYGLGPDPKGKDVGVRVLLCGNKALTPVEISAMILKKARQAAEDQLKEPVTGAVITVPAYFDKKQNKATEDAAAMAEIEVLQLLDEPSAAAVAANYGHGKRNLTLVYDLGGGTFDVSILQTQDNQFRVNGYEGDNWMGGDDFDHHLVLLAAAHLKKTEGHDPMADSLFRGRIRPAVEQAKIALSSSDRAEINCPRCCEYPGSHRLLSVHGLVVTRAEYEQMIQPQVAETLRLVKAALAGKSMAAGNIEQVLLVGGSTYTPMVRKMMEDEFPGRVMPVEGLNPMHCVAQGAAIQANVIQQQRDKAQKDGTVVQVKGVVSGRVVASSLGIAAKSGNDADVFAPILCKDTRLPLREIPFQTLRTDSPDRIFIPVYEGDDRRASKNRHQGDIVLPNEKNPIPLGTLPPDTPVQVGLSLNTNGIIEVRIRIEGRAEIIEQLEYTSKDAAWISELETVVQRAQGFLSEYGYFIPPESKDEIERLISQAPKLIHDENRHQGKAAESKLNRLMLGDNNLGCLLFKAAHLQHNQRVHEEVRTKLGALASVARDAFTHNQTSPRAETAAQLEQIKREIEICIAVGVRSMSAGGSNDGSEAMLRVDDADARMIGVRM